MKRSSTVLALALVALPSAGCDKKASTSQTSTASSSLGLSPDAKTAASQALSAYEDVRAALARDAVEGVAAAAQRLEASAKVLATAAPAALKPHASALAVTARDLGAKTEVEPARVAFGEVSRHVVALLVIEPGLRGGRHIFECPMAQGYKKWVQPKDVIDNPYMGKAMLTCGAESEWKT